MKYTVHVAVDASYDREVEADSVDQALEKAYQDGPAGLCYQCAKEFELESSTNPWVHVYNDASEMIYEEGAHKELADLRNHLEEEKKQEIKRVRAWPDKSVWQTFLDGGVIDTPTLQLMFEQLEQALDAMESHPWTSAAVHALGTHASLIESEILSRR